MREFVATEDCIIWFGRGCPVSKYESNKLDSTEKNKLIVAGLQNLKANCKDVISNEILAKYYHEQEHYSKSLYWAFSGAEKGSNYCMGLLCWAYALNRGVVRDEVESSKWMYLASARGNKGTKKLLEGLNQLNRKAACYMTPEQEEGFIKAQEWQKQHLDLFLDRD